MRDAFADEATRLAAADGRLVLLAGDIGNRLFDRFKAAAPGRFVNCGVAEANMVGVAAGLALVGMRPLVYSIAPFVTTRVFEQLRDDVCYHQAPVVIVGVGAGLSYASLGATHQSCEDIALLRSLPHMAVLTPADGFEVRALLRAALSLDGPAYIRLGKKGEPAVHAEVPAITLGKGLAWRQGRDVCLLAVGTMLPTALAAADRLEAAGVSAAVVGVHTVKPLDEAMLSDAFSRYAVVATVEEHGLVGGFGGAVAEWLADHGRDRARLLRCATPQVFLREAGSQAYARRQFGLTPEAIAERVLAAQLRGG